VDERNQAILLREHPDGPVTDRTFELVERPVVPPAVDEVLVRTLWLSFDPAQRGWINPVRSYVAPVELGAVMRAYGVGEVVASRHAGFSPGDVVHGVLGWQQWAVGPPGPSGLDLSIVPSDVPDPKLALGVLGITGLTAYFGMDAVGRVGHGDTVLVTSAAGATGSLAGQIARLRGAERVVGTAGTEEKRTWVRDVAGFDECVDHHGDHLRRRLSTAAPAGYDVVFDNVGGAVLDAALLTIAVRARVVLCGSISTGYAPGRPDVGLHNYQLLTTRRSRMEGFLVSDFADGYDVARRELLGWLEAGVLHFREDVVDGLEQAPATLRRLFEGTNQGKQLLRVADPSTAPRVAIVAGRATLGGEGRP
jgi:NADPH-dependent curcumin reductase CurA